MLKELIREIMPSVIEIRHQLHQIPELKFSEFQTAALIGEKLTSYGYQVQTNVGKTGLVALLEVTQEKLLLCAPIWTHCLFRKKLACPISPSMKV